MNKNHNFDLGQIFKRREALALFKTLGTAIFTAGCLPKKSPVAVASPRSGCVVSPEQTEGPYFVDEKLKRSDIRSDPKDGSVKQGVPLELTLHCYQVGSNGCTPIVGAIVDIWQCDALGVYSDVIDRNFKTVGQKFLRGYQVTDAQGNVQFTTIYPGWYPTRTVHIHLKIRTNGISRPSHEFTSQLYFDDTITDRVHSQEPYASKGKRQIKNADDFIFQRGGKQMLLKLTENGKGYKTSFNVGFQIA